MKRTLVIALVFCSVLYLGDYLSLRFRISKSRAPFGSVTIKSYYAVKQKNGTTEMYFLNPQTETCVHSLFPHLGYLPCWYLSRRTTQRINL